MNAFPYLAVFTVCASFAVLRASFEDLREAPLALGVTTAHERTVPARRPRPTPAEADDGLLDQELASADPINAWLDRYLTPPTQ
jgi:hypothetical protein